MEKIRLRSDSAGYNHKLLDWCDEHDIGFVVATEKKQVVMELVKSRRETSLYECIRIGNPFYEVFCNAKWRVIGWE